SGPLVSDYTPVATVQSSALFPYTTLFRSLQEFGIHVRSLLEGTPHIPATPPPSPASRSGVEGGNVPDAVGRPFTCVAARSTDPTDRKSTRLNSSHVKISYAGFCLKKKSMP